MTTLLTKHQRLAALRPLSPESVASLAAARDMRMVYESTFPPLSTPHPRRGFSQQTNKQTYQ